MNIITLSLLKYEWDTSSSCFPAYLFSYWTCVGYWTVEFTELSKPNSLHMISFMLTNVVSLAISCTHFTVFSKCTKALNYHWFHCTHLLFQSQYVQFTLYSYFCVLNEWSKFPAYINAVFILDVDYILCVFSNISNTSCS